MMLMEEVGISMTHMSHWLVKGLPPTNVCLQNLIARAGAGSKEKSGSSGRGKLKATPTEDVSSAVEEDESPQLAWVR